MAFLYLALWLLVAIVAHELAHALVARVVGAQVFAVELGRGVEWLRGRALGLTWILRVFPTHGMTHSTLAGTRWFRTRLAAIALAGPAGNLVLALLGWRELAALDPEVRWAGAAAWPGWQSMFIVNGWFTLANLLPIAWPGRGVTRRSDGLVVARVLTMREADVARELALHDRHRRSQDGWEHYAAGRFGRAVECFESVLDEVPDDAVAAGQVVLARAALDGPELAFELNRAVRDALDADPGVARFARVMTLANAAFLALECGRPELRAQADADSAEALRLLPGSRAVQRIRGAVLVQLGDVAQGERLLRRAYWSGEPAYFRAIAASWLALAARRRGDARAERRWLARARRHAPSSPTLARVERELGESRTRDSDPIVSDSRATGGLRARG